MGCVRHVRKGGRDYKRQIRLLRQVRPNTDNAFFGLSVELKS
jgi:hypothetical protein